MQGEHFSFSDQNLKSHYTKSTPKENGNYNFYDMHIHDQYEIYYFIRGDVSYYIEGHNYQIETGDLLMINNKEVHKPVFNTNKSYERLTIHFTPWHFAKYNSSSFNLLNCFENREPGHNNLIPAKKINNNNIEYYINQFIKYLKKEEKGKEIMLESLFIQFLYHLNKVFDKNKKKKCDSIEYNEKVTRIIKYINDNLNEKFTLKKIAKEFYLDKYYLSHLFKKSTGFSLLHYINHKKIMKSKELLSKNMSCSQVADHLNFGNYSNFYKTFKKETGFSPSEYQKSNI